jgi:hypothetical protein
MPIGFRESSAVGSEIRPAHDNTRTSTCTAISCSSSRAHFVKSAEHWS